MILRRDVAAWLLLAIHVAASTFRVVAIRVDTALVGAG